MKVINNIYELKTTLNESKQHNQTLGFVPTMGALHEGHLSLIQQSKKQTDVTAVSIFVNPMQFAPHEDLDQYPRPLQNDLALCEDAQVDVVFVPSIETMYQKNFSFKIIENSYSTHLCGAYRKGYFDGICTVMMKLLHMVPCQKLFMGLKDVEQVKVIEKMIEAFHLPVELVPCPTVRENSGLAMSSRNQYLSDAEKNTAKHIYQALKLAQTNIDAGQRHTEQVINQVQDYLKQYSQINVQYLKILDWDIFSPIQYIEKTCVIAIAAFVGKTRLIDNLIVDVQNNSR